MQVCWPANYGDYQLESARRLSRIRPERTKWRPVNSTVTTNSETCCATVKIARHGKTFRIVPP